MEQALAGIRVLDLTLAYLGPYATQLLAYMGAEVIHVESPRGELSRGIDARGGTSHMFALLNNGKKSITLDLRTREGQDIFRQLLGRTDIFVQNYAYGIVEGFGFSWETLQEINPRLIYATATGYGSSGPYRDWSSLDIAVQAKSGLMSVNGYPDRPPCRLGAAVTDPFAGLHLLAGALAAMYQRERTGRGRRIEVSLHDAAVGSLAINLAAYYASGRVPERQGSGQTSGLAPMGVFETSDGYCALTAIQDNWWNSLLEILDRTELKSDPRFATPSARRENKESLDEIVNSWTRTRTKHEVEQELNKHGVPAGAVLDLQDILSDPQYVERETFVETEHPILGRLKTFGNFIKFSDSPSPRLNPAPALGEDNDSVYIDLLGYTAEAVAKFKANGTI